MGGRSELGPGSFPLISYAEALATVLKGLAPLGEEEVPLSEAAGRLLASEVRAEEDLPLFARSAMDGYAVRSGDTSGASPERPVRLRLQGEAAAGGRVTFEVGSGQAARIFTGAPIPQGADAVVPQEDVGSQNGIVELSRAVEAGACVLPRGEDAAAGELMVLRGVRLGGSELGLLAQLGRTRLRVFRRPRVAILSTGSELVPAETRPSGSLIRESNGIMLASEVERSGGIAVPMGLVGDDREGLRARLEAGLEASDVLLVTGGMSVGDHDLVKPVLETLGVETGFWRVAIKPGKPFLCGRRGAKAVFGLPGNPASARVTFEMLVKPALRALAGWADPLPRRLSGMLEGPVAHRAGRLEFSRVRAEWSGGRYLLTLAGRQGSSALLSLVRANALAWVPAESGDLPAGSQVEFTPLERSA